MVSEYMVSSMFANILHVMRLRQAVRMNTSVINFTPQLQHLVIRTSCQGCKWQQDHPLPSPPTVLRVSNEAIFNFYHWAIGTSIQLKLKVVVGVFNYVIFLANIFK